ncbi:hypothetical protein C0993_009667, partial [Termitomyces sp. T159_Od127]
MFEVLWKSGDRTWMSYHQVEELDLLPAYLDLLEVESIADLPDGVGVPPPDDPQTYLGNLKMRPLKSEGELTCEATQDLLITPISSLSLSVVGLPSLTYSMPPYRNDHRRGGRHSYSQPGFSSRGHLYDNPSPLKHPWVHQNADTQMVHIIPPGRKPGFVIHPYQMIEYLEFNKRICKQKGRMKFATPFGFDQFAELFNSMPVHEYKYRLATYNAKADCWMVPAHRAKANHIHTWFVDQKRYQELITMGLVTEHGNVDPIMLKTTMAALHQPHIANSSKTYFYQRRRDERKEHEKHESESESDFSDEEEFLEDNTHRGRSLSPCRAIARSLQHSLPPSQPITVPSCTRSPPSAEISDTIVRNARGSPVVRAADGTISENRYTPDSPCATCNPVLLNRAMAEEDVQMKSVDNSKVVEEFFNF